MSNTYKGSYLQGISKQHRYRLGLAIAILRKYGMKWNKISSEIGLSSSRLNTMMHNSLRRKEWQLKIKQRNNYGKLNSGGSDTSGA